MSLPELSAHLATTHHAETRAALADLQEQVRLLLGCDQAQRVIFRQIGSAFIALRDLLETHLQEEAELLPCLSNGCPGGGHEPMRSALHRMRQDHNTVEEGLDALQELVESARRQWPECNSVRRVEAELQNATRRVHEQIYEEDHILYRRAETLCRPK